MTEGLSEAGPKLLQESRKDGVTKQCGRAKKDGKCLSAPNSKEKLKSPLNCDGISLLRFRLP